MSLYNFHAATGENMLVVDSKPLRNLTRHLIKSAIRKILQQRGSDSIKNGVWQVTLWWTLIGITLIAYMHIWLVEFNAILHKANFSYVFGKHFLQIKTSMA